MHMKAPNEVVDVAALVGVEAAHAVVQHLCLLHRAAQGSPEPFLGSKSSLNPSLMSSSWSRIEAVSGLTTAETFQNHPKTSKRHRKNVEHPRSTARSGHNDAVTNGRGGHIARLRACRSSLLALLALFVRPWPHLDRLLFWRSFVAGIAQGIGDIASFSPTWAPFPGPNRSETLAGKPFCPSEIGGELFGSPLRPCKSSS